MSVAVKSPQGWFVDACALIDKGCSRCIRWGRTPKSSAKCCFKRHFFNISKSHLSAGGGGKVDTSQDADTLSKKKKRKRKHSKLNQGEIDAQAFHEEIRSVILEGTKSLVDSAKSLGFLKRRAESSDEEPPCQECSLAGLCDMAKELPLVDDKEQGNSVQSLVAEDGTTSHLDLFSRVTENAASCGAVVALMGEEYVIPPRTAFLLSDFTRIQPLVLYGRKFDLIVMDPPWENKSVKRSRRYSTLPWSQLKQLPISCLASQNSLVVTWVTNRPSHLRAVCDELYPHWGLEVVAKWFWVKVTTAGEFVFPLDSQHKKPYEVLVLGRCRPPAASADHSSSSLEMSEAPVENHRLIISVPSVFHSQKPPLSEVLRPYVGAEARCLELFARSLQPGWTSWGNEVLRFQHTSYFTVMPSEDPVELGEDESAEEPEDNTVPLLSPCELKPLPQNLSVAF